MKFWALAYQYQEDVFYDFRKDEDTLDLTESCFLPTEALAYQLKAEITGDDYTPVEIELERLERNGTWTWSRGKVDRWDEE